MTIYPSLLGKLLHYPRHLKADKEKDTKKPILLCISFSKFIEKKELVFPFWVRKEGEI